MNRPQSLCVLGSTGSIGRNTLAVAKDLGLRIHSLSAHNSVELLAQQIRDCDAAEAAITDPDRAGDLRNALGNHPCRIHTGTEGAMHIAANADADTVMSAIVGAAGLRPTLAAIDAGKRVAIANKEPLVMAGELLMRRAQISGARILPVDSEHSAIFQCLDGHHIDEVARLQITGSGGPLRLHKDLSTVTKEQALAHPTWNMGPKITIDSASLMNKALEIIEARWLFDIPAERIQVLIHPQSIVHSLVAYRDGSLIAQLGQPDMRIPIQYALTWPRHETSMIDPPDLAALGQLTFEHPDRSRFPSLDLAQEALRRGGLAPTVLNAANECAVADFLADRCTFAGIFTILEQVMSTVPPGSADDLETVLAADLDVRHRLGH